MKNELTAQVVSGFNDVFGSFSSDALILVALFLVFFVYGTFRGKTNLVSLIISLYVGSLVFITFPYTKNFTLIRNVDNASTWSALIVFIVLVLLTHFILNKIILAGESFGSKRWVHLAELSVSGILSVIALSYMILPFGKLLTFSQTLSSFFHTPLVLFVSVLVSIVLIYTTNKY